MLPAAARLRRREDFTTVFRSGRKIARGPLVLHVTRSPFADDLSTMPRIGFVIPAKVGNAVARNRLRRRLRHLLRDRLDRLPANGGLVVRALPGAAELRSPELAALLDAALPAGGGR